MNNMTTVKLAANAMRHLAKYKGSNELDYIDFAKTTARKVQISKMDQIVCEYSGIYSINHLQYTQAEINEYMSVEEVREWEIENSNNAYQLAKIWKELRADADAYYSKECVIDEFLSQFPKSSFERFGDKSWLKDLHRGWFSEKGLSLDVQLQEMVSSSGLSIEIDDIIEFVKTYKRGEYVSKASKKLKALEQKWKDLFGFGIKEYYVEHLVKVCEFVAIIETTDVPF